MKKSDTIKSLKCLHAIKENLKNDFDVLKQADIKDFNFTYLKSTIQHIEEVSKSLALLQSYYDKKKIKI